MKKNIYMILVIILWIMLSYVAHVIRLARFGNWMLPPTSALLWCGYLPVRSQISVVITGVIVGYLVGQRRRQIVYVEKRHWRDWMKNCQK